MYGLCTDTVTILRGGEEMTFPRCALQTKEKRRSDRTGTWVEREFLLIVPGDRPIYPGDQLLIDGERATVQTVTPYFSDGKVCHREGRGV